MIKLLDIKPAQELCSCGKKGYVHISCAGHEFTHNYCHECFRLYRRFYDIVRRYGAHSEWLT